MSRIGRMPITVPAGVTVNVAEGNVVTVKGPKGELTKALRPEMILKQEGSTITVERPSDDKLHRSLHGLTRTLLHNMIVGVTDGYKKELEVNGVGYRVAKEGKNLVMNLGFSHQVIVSEIEGITIDVPAPNKIVINGCDKQAVGQFAAEVREKRPPEPYKGKGIKYADEVIRRKVGKTGAKKRCADMIKRPNTNAQRLKRHKRVRAKISGTPEMPRLNVFRSEANIYAQVIDDVNGVTLASASSLDKAIEGYGGNIAAATAVGKLVAERAKAKGIETVVFDRGGYLYHGRVKALAEGAREGGLKF